MTILAILEILREHTDAEHGLLQADIIDWLQRDYDLSATRKTVRQNIAELQDAGYPLAYDNGWYYEHEFCEAELDLLIQSLLFNSFVTPAQRQEMIGKLKALGGCHYTPRTFYDATRPANSQFLYTLEIIERAIEHEQKIVFQYMDLDVDKKLHPRLNQSGKPRNYLVNPYHVALSNGRYYLIGNMDKYDDVSHFRLDRIVECREMEEPIKPMTEVRGLERGLRIPEYMAGHVYMFSGHTISAHIRAKRYLAGDILDWFGMDVHFVNVTEDSLEAIFDTDESSLKYWLKQYGEHAEQVE